VSLQEKHRRHLLNGVSGHVIRFAASPAYFIKKAFAEGWRRYVARVQVEARFAYMQEVERKARENG